MPRNNNNNHFLKEIITYFNESSIEYIFLPNHVESDDRPEDIHFLVSESDFDFAGNILESHGWFSWLGPESGNLPCRSKYVRLFVKCCLNPVTAAKFALIEKCHTPEVIENIAGSLRGHYKQHILWNAGTRVNLHNHVAYKGSHTSDKIRIAPEVEKDFFKHKTKQNGWYQLDEPEMLLHNICNAVYDLSGEFSDDKIELCTRLYHSIESDSKKKDSIRMYHRFFTMLHRSFMSV